MSEPTEAAAAFTWDDVQRAISEAVAETKTALQEVHNREMDTLRAQVASTIPSSNIPEHGAGPGTTIRDTWSQAEQEAERASAEAARKALV